jgi:hypothetical protein
MNSTAPIILFCYRRKINKLINSLQKNKEASYSNLFIFSDGHKSNEDKKDVLDVRKSIKKISGFKSTKIFESEKNNGLSSSITKGITHIINNFGKAIILEDDLIVSKFFLQYMNKSLNIFQDRKDIWSISGYGPPLPCLRNYSHEVYLSCRTSSWGWATWKDRWNKTNWSMEFFKNFKKKKNLIKQFEQGGDDLFRMLELNFFKKIDSWDILWCYNQFINKSYSVFPKFSMSKNKGFYDGFETHTSGDATKWDVRLASCKINSFNTSLNKEIMMCFKKYHDLSFYSKIGYFLKKFCGHEITNKLKRYFFKLKF